MNQTRSAPAPKAASPQPLISILVLNYNGARWLERCLGSLRVQTIFDQLEIIVADNASPDQSDRLAADLMRDWPNGRVIQNGANLGYCEGNNRAAEQARGRYLFFLNNDTWLEPDCLERLLAGVQAAGAAAACPLIMNYGDNSVQSRGAGGFDIFGLPTPLPDSPGAHEIFVASGCALLIESALFCRLGGFDAVLFMYADEHDLCWRVWLAGEKAFLVPSARLHHRGAAAVNPKGEHSIVETRTTDTKRFYANRNCLLVLLKNAENVLLLLVPLQLALLAAEACVGLALLRRWSFVRRAYLEAITACWKLRGHILAERKRIDTFRRRSDWQMLRFLGWRLNRWQELVNLRRHGLPKVNAQ